MKKPTISLCIIVKNEGNFIENCMNSVNDTVDEIILVDTGSTDRTKEIAKKFGAKIFDFKWIDDFSAARNESLKHAAKDWILVLDADESISKNDLSLLRELISDNNVAGYYFLIRTYTSDSTAAGWVSSADDPYEESKSAAGYFTTNLIRLFRNDERIRFKGVVHETIDSSIKELGEVKNASFPIHHFGRLKSVKNDIKRELYSRLGELKICQTNDFHAYSQLGIQAQEAGDYAKAIDLFNKSIELNRNYPKSWLNLGACCLKLGRLEDAENALKQAAHLNPSDYSSHNNLGIVYSELDKPEIAMQEFLKALELSPKSANVYFNLGLLLDKTGAKDKAYVAFKKAIGLNPKYKEKIRLG